MWGARRCYALHCYTSISEWKNQMHDKWNEKTKIILILRKKNDATKKIFAALEEPKEFYAKKQTQQAYRYAFHVTLINYKCQLNVNLHLIAHFNFISWIGDICICSICNILYLSRVANSQQLTPVFTSKQRKVMQFFIFLCVMLIYLNKVECVTSLHLVIKEHGSFLWNIARILNAHRMCLGYGIHFVPSILI